MKNIFFAFSIAVFLTACNDTTVKKNLDGKKLIKQKCASCHDLNIPPKISDDELAPPMMAVSFHISNAIQISDESQRIPKAVAFVKDFVFNPDIEKSFCDKESLKRYGLMPSQKNKLSLDELNAIARYMFRHYTQENLSQIQEAKAKLDAMPKGQRLALTNNCLTCHKIDKDLVGPSLKRIASRYKGNVELIKHSIKNGSAKKFESSRGAVMPAFKNLSDNDLNDISQWIIKLNN